jgi:hypothetical protein
LNFLISSKYLLGMISSFSYPKKVSNLRSSVAMLKLKIRLDYLFRESIYLILSRAYDLIFFIYTPIALCICLLCIHVSLRNCICWLCFSSNFCWIWA